jgi:hypothetical protein
VFGIHTFPGKRFALRVHHCKAELLSRSIAYAKIVAVKTLLKSLIVWLMLLAIPFQGVASATMLVCAPIDSAPQRAAVASAVAGPHQHHAAHADAADKADKAAAHHHAGGKCNSCATCCFGAIMAPSTASRVPAEVQHFAFISIEIDQIASVDLAHPERPPQTSLS